MIKVKIGAKRASGAYAYKNLELVELRTNFLDAILRVAPEVVNDLQNTVYPIFEMVQRRAYQKGDHYHITSYRWFEDEVYSSAYELVKDLKEPLDMWATRWNIGNQSFDDPDSFTTLPAKLRNEIAVGQPVTTEKGTLTWRLTKVSVLTKGAQRQWVASLAIHSMWLWFRNPGYLADKYFSLPDEAYTPPLDEEQRSITFPTFEWEVDVESESDMKRRIMKALEAELEVQTKRIRALMVMRTGWQEPANKQRKVENHAEWLVRYQVQGWSQTQIAEHYSLGTNLDESTVSKAINKMAKKLSLKLRPPNTRGQAKRHELGSAR